MLDALLKIIVLAASNALVYPDNVGYETELGILELEVIIFSTSANRALMLVLATPPSDQDPLVVCVKCEYVGDTDELEIICEVIFCA